MQFIKTQADLQAALADIEARKVSGEITLRQAKRERALAQTAYDAYETSRLKSQFMNGRSAS